MYNLKHIPAEKEALQADNQRIGSIKHFLSQNLAADLHAGTVAKKFKLSVSALLHIFKKQQGQPYRKYVEQLRMNRALELIQIQGIRIKEVMYATGYANRAAFNKAFKKKYKRPPGYYKK